MTASFLILTTAKNGESQLKIKSCCLEARKGKMVESGIGESGAPWQLQRLQLRERLEMGETGIGEVAAIRQIQRLQLGKRLEMSQTGIGEVVAIIQIQRL